MSRSPSALTLYSPTYDHPSETCGGTGEFLPKERKRASFNVAELLKAVAGDRPANIAKYKPLFSAAPFDDQHLDDYASYAELFEKKIDRVTGAFKIIRDNPTFMFTHMKQKVSMDDYFEHNGIFLHFSMMLT